MVEETATTPTSILELEVPDPEFSALKDVHSPVKFLSVLASKSESVFFEDMGIADLVGELSITEASKSKDSSGSIRLYDPDGSLIESEILSEGTGIKVSMGFIGSVEDFGTWVVQETVDDIGDGGLELALNLQTSFVKMTGNNKAERWNNMSPEDVVKIIAKRYGLTPIVGESSPVIEELCKGGETDISFLKKLANSYGYEFFVRGNELHFHPISSEKLSLELVYRPDNPYKGNLKRVTITKGKHMSGGKKKDKKVSVKFGRDILASEDISKEPDIELELKSFGTGDREVIDFDELYGYEDPVTGENIPFEDLADTINLGDDVAQNSTRLKAARKISMKGIEVEGECSYGIPQLRAGVYVDIKGIGIKYEGSYKISEVTHTIDTNGYNTSFRAEAKTRARGRKGRKIRGNAGSNTDGSDTSSQEYTVKVERKNDPDLKLIKETERREQR